MTGIPHTTNKHRRPVHVDRYKRRVVVALLAVVALVATACGSSAGSATGTWKIGSIVDETGSGASNYAGTADVLQAFVKHVNDSGGIDGHKLDLIVKDDKSTPAGGLQAANELVREGVIAIVQGGSLVVSSWADVVGKAGIPVICGAPAASPPYGVQPTFYPCVPSRHTDSDLISKAAVDSGVKTIGVVACVESPACAAAGEAQKESAQKHGVNVVVQTTSFSSPSFAAPCLAMKQANAQILLVTAAPEAEFSFIDTCGQQGYRPSYVSATISDQFLTNKNVGSFVGLTEVAPYFADLPVLNTFRDVMQKDAANAYKEHPDTSATIWATGLLFQRAAIVGKLGDKPTAKDVTAALDSLSNETLDGMTAPLTFTNGNRNVPCGFVIAISEGKFTAPNGTKPVCPSQS